MRVGGGFGGLGKKYLQKGNDERQREDVEEVEEEKSGYGDREARSGRLSKGEDAQSGTHRSKVGGYRKCGSYGRVGDLDMPVLTQRNGSKSHRRLERGSLCLPGAFCRRLWRRPPPRR